MEFPKHKCGLYLEHNAHKDIYKDIEQWVVDNCWDYFENDDEKQKTFDTDEVWILQWYPDTPIGSYSVAASTLEDVLKFAKLVEKENLRVRI